MKKKVLLTILDGWGVSTQNAVSAIHRAETPFMDSLYRRYPHSQLCASGLAVGLPEGQMGNSEVGHTHIGAGRVVPQNLFTINNAINDKTIYRNEVLHKAVAYAKQAKKNIHLMGLLSDGGIHAHINHIKALLHFMAENKADRVFLHAFTDGRDTDPKSGIVHLQDILSHMQQTTGQLATIIGRYYAMDRNQQWDRICKTYDMLTASVGEQITNPIEAMRRSYDRGVTDEFINPMVLTDENDCPVSKILPDDVVICFNFRTDRSRQITRALTQQDMPSYNMVSLPLYYVTLTCYDETFVDIKTIFPKRVLHDTLGEVIANVGKHQLRIAETEKYPHVTFFFSGGRERPFANEQRMLCPSPKVPTYDLMPAMSAQEVCDKACEALRQQEMDFICLNFANPDMVGHTGVFEACVEACSVVDRCNALVTQTALENDYVVVVMADHGNAELMINKDSSPHTAHTTNLVPFVVVGLDAVSHVRDGSLGDVAPTILAMMDIPIPDVMTGKILLGL